MQGVVQRDAVWRGGPVDQNAYVPVPAIQGDAGGRESEAAGSLCQALAAGRRGAAGTIRLRLPHSPLRAHEGAPGRCI